MHTLRRNPGGEEVDVEHLHKRVRDWKSWCFKETLLQMNIGSDRELCFHSFIESETPSFAINMKISIQIKSSVSIEILWSKLQKF